MATDRLEDELARMPMWKSYLYHLQQQAPKPKRIVCQREVPNKPPYYGREYHGAISREDADFLLTIGGEGSYLIRESQRAPGQYTLAIRCEGVTKNFKLYYDGQHYVGEKRFDTVQDLVADGLITFYLESKAADYIASLSSQSNYAESPYVAYNTYKKRQLQMAPKRTEQIECIAERPERSERSSVSSERAAERSERVSERSERGSERSERGSERSERGSERSERRSYTEHSEQQQQKRVSSTSINSVGGGSSSGSLRNSRVNLPVEGRLSQILETRKKEAQLDNRNRESQLVEGRTRDLQIVEPRSRDSQIVEPRSRDSQIVEPRSRDSQIMDGRNRDSQIVDGRSRDSQLVDGRSRDSQLIDGRNRDSQLVHDRNSQLLDNRNRESQHLDNRNRDSQLLDNRNRESQHLSHPSPQLSHPSPQLSHPSPQLSHPSPQPSHHRHSHHAAQPVAIETSIQSIPEDAHSEQLRVSHSTNTDGPRRKTSKRKSSSSSSSSSMPSLSHQQSQQHRQQQPQQQQQHQQSVVLPTSQHTPPPSPAIKPTVSSLKKQHNFKMFEEPHFHTPPSSPPPGLHVGDLAHNFKLSSVSWCTDYLEVMGCEKMHNFKLHTFKGPHWCDFCANFLWGLISQGVRCQDCGFNAHKKCSEKVPNDCMPDMKYVKRMFGIDLTTLVKAQNTLIPLVVEKCIQEIEKRGVEIEGIYRVAGFHDDVEAIKMTFDKEGDLTDISEERYDDINTITSVLKLYFRLLPIPSITFDVYFKVIDTVKREDLSHDSKLDLLKHTLAQLPPAHYHTLKYLMAHLHRVTEQQQSNMMNSENLAIVFAPTLLRSPETDPLSSLTAVKFERELIEILIAHHNILFD